MAGIFVRFGHMMESGKAFDSWLTELDKLCDGFFKYRQVVLLPPAADGWAVTRRRIYEMTFVAVDMSREDWSMIGP